MSRTYTTHLCALWDDEQFCDLSSGAKETFFMLTMQPEMSAVGCIAITERRWSKMLRGKGRDDLAELERAGFVAVDEDTEEVFVVPFAENDGGYKHGKRVHAVLAALKAIRSPHLQLSAAKELARLGVSTGIVLPLDTQSVPTQEASGSVTDGVALVGNGVHPSSNIPHPASRSSATPTESQNERAQRLTKGYVELRPMSNFPAALLIVKKAISAGKHDDEISTALTRLAGDGRSLTVETLRLEIEGIPPPRTKRTNDDKVQTGLAVAERLRNREPQLTAIEGTK